ncbi:MAG TPA: hypothetical protein VHZ95_17600 [Polyangiales bacterium]|nr:hypothetical protein [Polyangiales bacterium]
MDPRQHDRLRALRDKYLSMRALRIDGEHASLIAPRARLAELARTFPGALRELDQLPMAEIDARLQAIESTLANGSEVAQWMQLQVSYHGFMRAVLRIRRSSRGRPLEIENAERELIALAYQPADDEPLAARFDLSALRTIRRPPAGRLNPWVLSEVAKEHGVAPELVHKALFLR